MLQLQGFMTGRMRLSIPLFYFTLRPVALSSFSLFLRESSELGGCMGTWWECEGVGMAVGVWDMVFEKWDLRVELVVQNRIRSLMC